MPVDMSQLPPQVQQALAAQAGGQTQQDMETVLATLAQDPEALAAAMQALGIQVTPEQLQQVAETWVEDAADKSTGSDAAQTAPPNAQPQADDEASEPVADDETAEGEQPQASPASASSSAPADNEEAMNAYAQGGAAGRGSGSPGGGSANLASIRQRMMASKQASPVDDIISAALAQQMTGDANAPVPDARAFKGPQRPALPHSPSATASADPRMRNMIGNIYRSIAMQNAGAERASAPSPSARRNARPSAR